VYSNDTYTKCVLSKFQSEGEELNYTKLLFKPYFNIIIHKY